MKFTNAEIVKALENTGTYEATEDVVVKNSVKFDVIRVMVDPSFSIIVYPERLKSLELDDPSIDVVVDEIIMIADSCNELPIDISKLRDENFVLANIRIGVQRSSDEKLIKKATPFEGIESYLYLIIDENSTMKLTENNIKGFPISEDDAWLNAEKNTFKDMEIKDILDLMKEMSRVTETPWDNDDTIPKMLAVTNKQRSYGAVAILNGEILRACADILVTSSLIIIPSSIHEILVVSGEDYDQEDVDEMVNYVNLNELPKEQILSNRSYSVHIEG